LCLWTSTERETVPLSLPLHRPLNVLIDDVRVDLSGGDPGVAQNVREVEQVIDSLLIFLKSFTVNRAQSMILT